MSVLPSTLYQRQTKGHVKVEKSLYGNKKIISGIMRTPPGDQSLFSSSWSMGRRGGYALDASNFWGRRSPSYFTALQDINNLKT